MKCVVQAHEDAVKAARGQKTTLVTVAVEESIVKLPFAIVASWRGKDKVTVFPPTNRKLENHLLS